MFNKKHNLKSGKTKIRKRDFNEKNKTGNHTKRETIDEKNFAI